MNILQFRKIKKALIALLCAVSLLVFSSCSTVETVKNTLDKIGNHLSASAVRITFPEGFTVAEIADLLEENGVCSAEEFRAECQNSAYLEEYGIVIDNVSDRAFLLEGYIFPDTYDFYLNEGAPKAIRRFLNNTKSKLTDEITARADELGYTVDEILNIASIIQGEASKQEDMEKVACVIYNRLNSKRFPSLQCDCGKDYLRSCVEPYFSGERYEELWQLYDSYECEGIPAGPINNPGTQAINAALYPAQTDYYYFASDKDGNYYYGKTYEEHLRYCEDAGIGIHA